ncbi:Uncharacterised protein [Candidatus Burarchaeum australiense]|nr:Uncharacterised protein [Candidatus Burarchaeum australiense]
MRPGKYGERMLSVGPYGVYAVQDQLHALVVFESPNRLFDFELPGSELLSHLVGKGNVVLAITNDWRSHGGCLVEEWTQRKFEVEGLGVKPLKTVLKYEGDEPPAGWFMDARNVTYKVTFGQS